MTEFSGKAFEFIQMLARELSGGNFVFPTSVEVTLRIRRMLDDTDVPVERVAAVIGLEPVLAGQIIRLANSAAWARSGPPVRDVRTAVTRLGFASVRNLALAVAMRQIAQAGGSGLLSDRLHELWHHSLWVAAMARTLAQTRTRLNPEEAMLCGLLHDIGLFYVFARAAAHPELFTDEATLDTIAFEWHSGVGHAILDAWHLPEDMILAVEQHEIHQIPRFGSPDLSDVVFVADQLSAQKRIRQANGPDWTLPSMERLGLDASQLESLQASADQLAQEMGRGLAF